MILVDSSVWIDHFRRGNSELEQLLHAGLVLHHLLVFGELACGNLQNRREILGLFSALPQARTTSFEETFHFIEAKKLYGIGLGWIDVSILASAQLSGCKLWTLDKALLRASTSLNLHI